MAVGCRDPQPLDQGRGVEGLLEAGGRHPPTGLLGRESGPRPPERAAGGHGALPQDLGGMDPRMGSSAIGAPACGARRPGHGGPVLLP
eukprot:15423796-Alexandrium_andersonii.AAC.1